MAYIVRTTNRFDKNLEKMKKRGFPMDVFREVIKLLMVYGTVPSKYRPHKLTGCYAGKWECHLRPDWLLIWDQNDTELILLLIDTGTHSDLF